MVVLFTTLLVVLGTSATAAEPMQAAAGGATAVRPEIKPAGYDLAPYLKILEDQTGQLTFEDVSRKEYRDAFRPHEGPHAPNFSYTRSTWWLRFELDARVAEDDWLLELAYPLVQDITAYIETETGRFTEIETGSRRPFHERPLSYRAFLFPLPRAPGSSAAGDSEARHMDARGLAAGDDPGAAGAAGAAGAPGAATWEGRDQPQRSESRSVYLRARSDAALILPLRLWERDAFTAAHGREHLLLGLYFGVAAIMVLYNLFLFVLVRHRRYMLYVAYIVSIALFHLGLTGIGFQYLWPDWPWWANRSVVLFNFAGGLFLLLFASEVLQLRVRASQLYHVLTAVAVALAVMLPFSLILPYTVAMRSGIVGFAVAATVLLIAVFGSLMRGHKPARYLLVAWIFLIFGGVLLTGRSLAIFPHTFLTMFGIQLGSTFEIVILSLALADHTRRLQRERREAEHRAATDALTGLHNRRYFEDLGPRLMADAQDRERPLSIILIDADGFKRINDSYGHDAGDQVLRILGRKLKQNLRDQDCVARYGGDEFSILLADTGAAAAAVTAEKLRRTIETEPVHLDEYRIVQPTISLGVAAREDELEFARLVKKADHALYLAKQRGRNLVVGA